MRTSVEGMSNSEKETVVVDDDFGVDVAESDDGILYLNFETLDKRFMVPFHIRETEKERASDIFLGAFQQIGELIQEE